MPIGGSAIRRAVGVVAGASCLVAAAVATANEPPAKAEAAVSAPTSSTALQTMAPGSAASPSFSGYAPSRPAPAPARTAGPGLTTVGTSLVVAPTPSGELEVIERMRLAAPTTSVTLAVPQVQAPGLSAVRPIVSQLQIQAGQSPVAAPTASWDGQLRMTIPSSTVVALRYRIDAGTARSNPAPIGRVLVGLRPLLRGGGPVMVEVVGAGVRNVVCPKLPPQERTCGKDGAGRWSAGPLPAAKGEFVAQLDLAAPGA